MNSLNLTGLSLNTKWKNKEENFLLIEQTLENISTDLILLPEMFGTGFCMEPVEIADKNYETLNWLKKFATQKNAAIAGSVAVAEFGKFYNRLYFVWPDGKSIHYDKRHLFSYSGEDKLYEPGKKRVIVEYKNWKILLQVCYDLRFPVFSRNNGDYDAIIYVANWPQSRVYAWESLLKARAIENQCYVFGLNRTGTDGNGLHYKESSHCFFADGTERSQKKEDIIHAQFNREQLHEFRKKYRFLDDRDDFEIKF